MKLAYFLLILSLFQQGPSLFSDYPEIKELDSRDVLFKQIQADIQSYHRAASREYRRQENRQFPCLQIFSYRNRQEFDIFSLAARLNLPYDTIATLNGLENPADLKRFDRLLIPNLPGIFVPLNPKTGFQEILFSLRLSSTKKYQEIVIGDRKKGFLFFLGDSFHSLERAFFLKILFRFPLPIGRLTSRYGMRPHPFTGHAQFHQGIDIAAPEGTEVFAARDGIVVEVGFHPVLGNHVQLLHEGGYQTVYGHLASVNISLKQRISSGMIIGKVGSTGMSTGPHLHFEIRRQGLTRDPAPLLPMDRMNDQ